MSGGRSDPAEAPPLPRRCAIYTRKSSSEGLQQDFNSLDAQREACACFVASQAGEGWACLDTPYDDGGYSGGSLNRPAMRRLMADVMNSLIDVVVVYKIDRLSRSLVDFATLVGLFERHGVAFVAVTQSFNTASSMGRLTLNVLLSFAQFERELTGERLRDKFAASRARGLWLCGPRPYGYQVDRGRLSVDEAEAAVVREIFARYPRIGSCRLLAEGLTARGILNRFGTPFRGRTVTAMLRNRLYRGELPHAGGSVQGIHQAIVTERAWQAVQDALAGCGRRRGAPIRRPHVGLLSGILFGPSGQVMVHMAVRRPKQTYRYYVLGGAHRYGRESDAAWRFRAAELERSVVEAVQGLLPLSALRWPDEKAAGLARALVTRVDLRQHEAVIYLKTGSTLTVEAMGRLGQLHTRLALPGQP